MSLLLRTAALLSATLLAVPAVQADPKNRPFTAEVVTQETFLPNPAACPGTVLQGVTTGQGLATHMGKVTLRSTDCPVFTDTQFTFSNGRLVLTAANGDTLTADYAGALLPTPVPTLFSLSGSYRVTGGTGRFAGATGHGTLKGVSEISTGRSAYTAVGTIRY